LSKKNSEDLIILSKSGDVEAFEELMSQHLSRMYNVSLRLTGNPHDAWDLTQEASIKVYRSIVGFRGGCSFSTWVYHILINTFKDFKRKENRRNAYYLDGGFVNGSGEENTIEVPDSNYDPAGIYEYTEIGQFLQKLINEMKEDYRVIIILRDQRGFSYEEIAKILHISLGTVKSRLNRARSHLRKKLFEEQEQYPEIQRLLDKRKGK